MPVPLWPTETVVDCRATRITSSFVSLLNAAAVGHNAFCVIWLDATSCRLEPD
jgi:hypothetical protein